MSQVVVTRTPQGVERRRKVDDDLTELLMVQLDKLLVIATQRLLDRNEASLLKTLLDIRASLSDTPAESTRPLPTLEALPAETLLLLAEKK